jgi:hypothetical protein
MLAHGVLVMAADIVVPRNNEAELIAMAKRLGYDSLLLLSPVGKCVVKADNDIDMACGVLATAQTIGKANGIVALQSSDHDFALVSAQQAPRFLIGLGESTRPDKLHQRVTGIDQPLLRELAKHKVSVVLSFASLLARSGQERAQLLGRWMAIVPLCRKAGVRVIIASCATEPYQLRSPQDLQSLGILIGMHPTEASSALSWSE